MALEFAKQWKTMRNDHLVSGLSSSVVNSAFGINCGFILQSAWIFEPTGASSVWALSLAIFRWRTIRGRMVVHHELSHENRILRVIWNFCRDNFVDVRRVSAISRKFDEYMHMR
jgi:hypothetical protein